MKEKTEHNRVSHKQMKSLNPRDDPEINSEFYGNEENISTQIITNYYFNSNEK